MKAMILAENMLIKNDGDEDIIRRTKKRWTIALFVSLIFGIVSGFFGLAASALNLVGLLARIGPGGQLGTILIILAFPLMMFSAHCLDRIELAERHLRIEKAAGEVAVRARK